MLMVSETVFLAVLVIASFFPCSLKGTGHFGMTGKRTI
jgi:hypothetical protein